MLEARKEGKPEDYDMPHWWNSHGVKMHLVDVNSQANKDEGERIRIVGSAAELRILQTIINDKSYWLLKWKVTQSQTEGVEGRVVMRDIDLKRAFGLTDEQESSIPDFLRLYGVTVGAQGLYARYNHYLNIPVPGTGHDGDPNISIKLYPQIIYEVAGLFEGEELHPAPSVAQVFSEKVPTLQDIDVLEL